MLFTAHAAVGGVAGEYLNSPFLAFIAGIILHFILDAIPHYDVTDNGKFTLRQNLLIIIDVAIGLILFAVLYDKIDHPVSFLAGSFGCILPDIVDLVPFWNKYFHATKFGKRFHSFHAYIQSIKVGPIFGLSIQAIIIITSVLILISK